MNAQAWAPFTVSRVSHLYCSRLNQELKVYFVERIAFNFKNMFFLCFASNWLYGSIYAHDGNDVKFKKNDARMSCLRHTV